MNRREFLKNAAFAASVAAAPGLTKSASAKPAKKPNVIYILADDLGYRELGCYGQEKIRTPYIDKLAEQGMKFTNHYCGQAVCAPSRCALMTGKHMGHAYVRNNRPVGGGYQLPLPEGTTTIGTLFQKHGYKTGAMGKWGLGGPDSVGRPNNQGFDHFFGNIGQVQAHWYYPPYMYRNTTKIEYPENKKHTGNKYSHDLMEKEALDFIKDNKDNPFFLYLPFIIPHVSLQVPDDEILQSYLDKGWEEKPYKGGHYTGSDTPKAVYAAMITRMDRSVGRVMSLLSELGLEDDTLIMFSSDNGTTYCCGVDYEFFNSVGDFRGLKGSLYEGGIRVPMIAKWPGRIKPGTTTDHISAFWDVLPTMCDVLNADKPADTDGISFMPILLGKPEHQKPHEYLYWEFPSYGFQQAVRMGDWKGYRRNLKKDPDPKLQLYNLKTDPSEQNDVADQHPEVVKNIETIMKEAHTPSEKFPLLHEEFQKKA
ncbi:Arylsulfatase precursor [Anaerohalosphaera lusitana]|uniref:Arylsulfatase n=1 Tax=Anaerohalosphaera lusitana TaxID=1936003 RepID=A0A1U9NJW4_9BACT|nr:arylsulfatase [Anaerohalosphaera lusitana]AQT68199.1 Arylsulfatase precursor [Anaerohalosphaera lusitana]